jgi:hypothetical protein
VTDPFTIVLTPAGHLLLRPAEPREPAPEPAAARRIRAAFERGHAAGLLHLGAAEARTPLPPVLAFWRDLGSANGFAVLNITRRLGRSPFSTSTS